MIQPQGGAWGNAWIDRRASVGAAWLDQVFTASLASTPAPHFCLGDLPHVGDCRFFEGHGVAFGTLVAYVMRNHCLSQATSHRVCVTLPGGTSFH